MESGASMNYCLHLQRIYFFSLFLSVLITQTAFAQKEDYAWKLSPLLAKQIRVKGWEVKMKLRVTISGLYAPGQLRQPKFEAKKISADNNYTFINITCSAADLFSEVLPLTNIIFIE